VPIDPAAAEALGVESAAYLQEIITEMGMESTVTSHINEELDIVLEVAAEDSAILIGRKGRNLEAMQFLLNRIMLKGEENDVVDRIVVDVEGYIKRRRESLEEMALSMAARAKESGRSLRIKPLDAHERRIVHLVLEKDEDLRTFSLGGGALRRVVIIPENVGKVSSDEAKDADEDVDDVETDVDTDNAADAPEVQDAPEADDSESDVSEDADDAAETDDSESDAGEDTDETDETADSNESDDSDDSADDSDDSDEVAVAVDAEASADDESDDVEEPEDEKKE
jgi:spoIIIJ-associated protein